MVQEEKQNKEIKFPVNTLRICIDSVKNEELSGRIYSKMHPDPIQFGSVKDIFFRCEDLFDEKGYPQAFTRKRNMLTKRKTVLLPYRPNQEVIVDDASLLSQAGKVITFDVIVKSRKRTTWQGLIKEEENTRYTEFQSEMELLQSMLNTLKQISKTTMEDLKTFQ